MKPANHALKTDLSEHKKSLQTLDGSKGGETSLIRLKDLASESDYHTNSNADITHSTKKIDSQNRGLKSKQSSSLKQIKA